MFIRKTEAQRHRKMKGTFKANRLIPFAGY